jgi:hypothetical protein
VGIYGRPERSERVQAAGAHVAAVDPRWSMSACMSKPSRRTRTSK